MITSFPNNKTNASSDQAIKRSNTTSAQPTSKVVHFANIQNLNHEKSQYDQAKQAINQAASSLNW